MKSELYKKLEEIIHDLEMLRKQVPDGGDDALYMDLALEELTDIEED